MRIVVTGGTGFIGRPLCQRLLEIGHSVTVLTRDPATCRIRLGPRVQSVGWQGYREPAGEWAAALDGSDAVINLAGAPIADRRWSAHTKERVRHTREGATMALVEALHKLQRRPDLLISASAIGYYGPRDEERLTEDSASGTGFLVRQQPVQVDLDPRPPQARAACPGTLQAHQGALTDQLSFKLGDHRQKPHQHPPARG